MNSIFLNNKLFNEQEITQKKTVIDSKPRAVHLTLTDRCNMKCQFCYLEKYKARWDMPEKACNEIMDIFPCLQRLVWQGGEAFLHPKFLEMLVESAKFPDIEQTMITNASFIDEKWVEIFEKIPKFNFVVSLESVNKEMYEHFRRGGKFELLKRNIGLLNEARKKNVDGIQLSLTTIVMKSNYKEMEDIVDFAVSNGFHNITINPLYLNGTEFNAGEYIAPDAPDLQNHFNNIMPSILEKVNRNRIFFNDRFSVARKELRSQCFSDSVEQDRKANDQLLCHAPWQQLFIETGGDVNPNCYCRSHIIGNVNVNSISEIWNGSILQKMRQDIIAKNYAGCASACLDGLLDTQALKLR